MRAGSPGDEPLITVGISCHAEGDWLREAWESVLAQTDPRWCAVLVMDGTTHARTREVFEELDHPRLRKCALPANVGPYPVRNRAFELTDTPYHFYLDGDDLLVPTSVAAVLGAFERHPEAAFVYGDYECFGERTYLQRHAKDVTWDSFTRGQPTPGACAYTKALWAALGGFAPELARGNADYDFLIGAAELGAVGRHCGEVFYRYRRGLKGTVSTSYDLSYHETHEIIVRRHPRFFADARRRDRFLAHGHRRSAFAHHAAGHPELAMSHGLRAVRLGLWGDTRLWRLIAAAGIARAAR